MEVVLYINQSPLCRTHSLVLYIKARPLDSQEEDSVAYSLKNSGTVSFACAMIPETEAATIITPRAPPALLPIFAAMPRSVTTCWSAGLA